MRKYWDNELKVSIAVPTTDCMGKRYLNEQRVAIPSDAVWYSQGEWIAEIGNVRYKGKLTYSKGNFRPSTMNVTAQNIDKKSGNYLQFYTTKVMSAC